MYGGVVEEQQDAMKALEHRTIGSKLEMKLTPSCLPPSLPFPPPIGRREAPL